MKGDVLRKYGTVVCTWSEGRFVRICFAIDKFT